MNRDEAHQLQWELKELFEDYGVNVAVGLHVKDGDYGVALRSQDPQVDALNIGDVHVFES